MTQDDFIIHIHTNIKQHIVMIHFISELAPRVFFKLTELKLLDLSNNPIQFIDGATFVDIPDLEIFKCNHCELFQVNNFTKILNFHTFY